MSDKYEGLPPLPKPLSTSKHWDGGIDWPLAGERAARLEREDQLRSLLQERDQLRPVEPPQWEDYFRALKLSYPENLTAIYVAKEVYSMFMSALARESPEDAWRQQPDSQGWWWHWDENPDHAPFMYSLLTSLSRKINREFIASPDGRWCVDVGGLWLKAKEPLPPYFGTEGIIRMSVEDGSGKFFGIWPGDETDKQLLAAIDEIRKPDDKDAIIGQQLSAEDRLLKEVMLHAVTKFELKQAAETIRQMTELLREYRYDRFDIRHGFCGTRVAGLVNLIEIDERCSLCIKADLLLKENK